MLRSVFNVLMLALVLFVASCSSGESTPVDSSASTRKAQGRDTFRTAEQFDPDDVAAIHDLRKQWAAAFAGGNAKPVEFMFTNDALFKLPNGAGATEDSSPSAQDIFNHYNSRLVFDESSEQFVTDGGDPRKMTKLPWVSYYSAYKLTLEPKSGGHSLEAEGRFMTRLHRQPDGSLSVIRGPDIGTAAPDFTLNLLKRDGTVRLSSLRGKPTVLIFGSYT